MTFGQWLRQKLNDKRMSNAELARRVHVSPTYVSNLVRDYSPNMISNRAPRPGEDIVERIARALGAPLDEARLAANYAPRSVEDGIFSGLDKLSPKMQRVAKAQIRAIIDSLQSETDTEDEN